MTEAEELSAAAEFKVRSELFMLALDVDDVIAHLLVAEGFSTIEEIIETPVEELSEIEGFEDEILPSCKIEPPHILKPKRPSLKSRKSLIWKTRSLRLKA